MLSRLTLSLSHPTLPFPSERHVIERESSDPSVLIQNYIILYIYNYRYSKRKCDSVNPESLSVSLSLISILLPLLESEQKIRKASVSGSLSWSELLKKVPEEVLHESLSNWLWLEK